MNGKLARALRHAARDEHRRWLRDCATVRVAWWARLTLATLRWLTGLGVQGLGPIAQRVGRAGLRVEIKSSMGARGVSGDGAPLTPGVRATSDARATRRPFFQATR